MLLMESDRRLTTEWRVMMRRISILLLSVVLTFVFFGCVGGIDKGTDLEEDSNESARRRVNYEEDAYDLMETDRQAFLTRYENMVLDFFDQDHMDGLEADYYYILNNGVEVGFYDDRIVSINIFYDRESLHPVPVLKGIGGEDKYKDAVDTLGEQYYKGAESVGREGKEKEYFAAVFYVGKYRYVKIYFDSDTEFVSHIACFYGEAPDFKEAGGIKAGDDLDRLKAAYRELYYETAYYDSSQGDPKYNRIYYTPTEVGDRGVECTVYYVYNKKVVKITSNVYDVLGWSNYVDIFGMKGILKENNMIGHKGNIVYFYDSADGKEQVLLTIDNCATEEIDVDNDDITEIIAYKAGEKMALVIYDYDPATDTILKLDVCDALGAQWSSYRGNMSNGKQEYSRCIEAGFDEEDGSTRIEVYSVKDNILAYLGPYSQDLFQ